MKELFMQQREAEMQNDDKLDDEFWYDRMIGKETKKSNNQQKQDNGNKKEQSIND